eukprot:g13258.t1
MMLTVDHDNGGASPPAHPEPNLTVGVSGRARGIHVSGSSDARGGGGGGDGRGGNAGDGAMIPNRGGVVQDEIINPFAAPSDVYGPALQEASSHGGGGGGGFGETRAPAMELQGEHWVALFRGLALLCVWWADHVASRVESPAISSLVRDLCVQASFAVLFGALHGLHRWGLVDEATRADIAGVMPTWDPAWIVFATRDPHAGATDGGGGGGGGGETLPGGDGGGGGRRHHAGRRRMFWRVLFWWVVRLLGLAVVSCCLATFIGEDSPSVSTMLRDWCKPMEQLLVTALLCVVHLWGVVDRATWEDIAARLPVWYNGA